jgi:ribosomal protein S18 acetylase RimI-like enzyme
LKQAQDDVERECEKGVFLKAVDEKGEIIGSVRAYMENSTAFIGKLIVHPERQGHGIGTELLLTIEKEYPAGRYELFTSDKSVRNIRLYERLGYKRFRERRISDNLVFAHLEKWS